MKLPKKKLTVLLAVLMLASQAQSTESSDPTNQYKDPSEDDFEAILESMKACEGNPDPSCIMNALDDMDMSVDTDMFTACALRPNISPKCSEIIPKETTEGVSLMQICIDDPNAAGCEFLPNDLRKILSKNKPAYTPAEIAATYEEGYRFVISCVNGGSMKLKYLNLSCSEVVPPEVLNNKSVLKK